MTQPNITPEHAQTLLPFLIGAVGGVVALRFAPGLTWPERAFNVASASAVAGFCGPAIAEWFTLRSSSMSYAAVFLVGLFGLGLTATVMEWIRTAKLSDLLPWFKKGE